MNPQDAPQVSTETFSSAVVIPKSYTAFRDETVAAAALVKSVAFPNNNELDIAVAADRELRAIIKAVEAVEATAREPLNARLKELRRDRDNFLATVTAEHARLQKLIDGFSTSKHLHDQAEARRLADEQRAAQAAQWKAEAEIKRQEEELARKKRELENAELSKTQRAEAERQQKEAAEKLREAAIKAEEAALTAQSVESQLAAPTTSARGLTVKVRWDFEIVKYAECIVNLPDFWAWKKDDEILKFDRAGFLRTLNQEGSGNVSPFLPKEGESEALNSRIGIRVFIDVKGHTRR